MNPVQPTTGPKCGRKNSRVNGASTPQRESLERNEAIMTQKTNCVADKGDAT